MLEDTIRFIEENRLIAIVRGIAPKKCLKVADALYEGGFRLVEVTFNQKEPIRSVQQRMRSRRSRKSIRTG